MSKEVTINEDKTFNIHTREGLMLKLCDMLHNVSQTQDEKYLQNIINKINRVKI